MAAIGTAWGRSAIATLAAVVLVAGAGHAAESLFSPEMLAQYFRLEWQMKPNAKRPVIQGYVYNRALRDVEHLRVQVERLNAAGDVEGTSGAWVLGTVPRNGGRAYFSIAVPAAAGYRVAVQSFDWTCGEGGGGSM